MKKYLLLQYKKILKLFPFVLVVTLILFTGLAVVFGMIVNTNSQKEENQIFNIALTGDTDNDYLHLGLSALSSMDQTRFSMKLVEMNESKAEKALAKGEISAYVVFPEDFMDKALSGDVEPIKYVTTSGNRDVVTLFKNEITKLITDMVVACQKGTYGLADALMEADEGQIVNRHMSNLSLRYVDLILHRSEMVTVDELGISGGLSTVEYYICGIFIVFIMLMGLPFATMYIKDDYALSRLLISKGYSNFVQQTCEYIAHLTSLVALATIVFSGVGLMANFANIGLKLPFETLGLFALNTLPTLIMISAFNIMIFELSSNMVGGVLLHFFSTLGLCYISGCFYPIYAFPKAVQQISSILPVGVARQQLASFFTEEGMFTRSILVLLYAALFFGIALLLRRFKTVNGKGGIFVAKTV